MPSFRLAAPSRGDNGNAGTAATPGTKVANIAQQDYFVDVATKVVLPLFKARNRPFVLVFWSRDPDGTQHNQGDSLNQLTPGINGPTSLASIKNADDDLGRIQKALADLGLTDDDRHLRDRRSRLRHDLQGKQDEPGGARLLLGCPGGLSAAGFVAHRHRGRARHAAL